MYYLNSRYYDPEIGRFINIDDISVLSETQNTFNGLNLFAYCHNNPVSRDDEYGYFFWFFIIAIVVGAVVGGTVNTVQAYQQGARGFKNLFGAFLGGAIMGAAMGAIATIGGAIGLTAFTGVSVLGISSTSAILLSAGIGISAGLISYSVEAGIRDDMNWNIIDFAKSGFSGLVQGISTFFVASIGGYLGAFDKILLNPMLKGASTLSKSITYSIAKALIGRKIFVTPALEFTLKNIIISSISSIIRNLVNKTIK